jgi:hypothetical protein
MSVFLCRWPNGDFSVVKAANKDQAIEFLDEVGNAESCPVIAIKDFMVRFHLGDDGEFELEGYGEMTEDHIMMLGYPELKEAFLDEANYKEMRLTEEGQNNIRQAVKKERERLWPQKEREPKTLLGRRIQAASDAPSKMIDGIVEKLAKEKLRKFKGKGKTN